MNLFQLIFKQMRQRSLSTWLTLLSVLLGVGLASSIMLLSREGRSIFVQSEYGFDVVIGAKGSRLQLILNSVYHMDQSPGNIPYSVYEDLVTRDPFRRQVRWAVPFAVGDSYRGHRVVATLPAILGLDEQGNELPLERSFQIRPGQRMQLAEGRVFHPQKFEAVIGSETAERTGLRIGDTFEVEHGLGGAASPDVHGDEFTVVGILHRTYTAKDRVLFVPLIAFYAIDDHHMFFEAVARVQQPAPGEPGDSPAPGEVEAAVADDADIIHLDLPKERWQISGVYVQARSAFLAQDLMWFINNGLVATAANPAMEMSQFFDRFFDTGVRVLLAISVLVTIVAAVSILVSIYNSVSARKREIAILRALGATKNRVLAIICLEAGLIGLVGGLLGLALGRLIGAASSGYFRAYTGQGINWLGIGAPEWIYLGVVVLIALLAGLVPALKAYRTPVATNLMSG
jgi:putative ABC transport system permease protein